MDCSRGTVKTTGSEKPAATVLFKSSSADAQLRAAAGGNCCYVLGNIHCTIGLAVLIGHAFQRRAFHIKYGALSFFSSTSGQRRCEDALIALWARQFCTQSEG
jgi:hypothetical protein